MNYLERFCCCGRIKMWCGLIFAQNVWNSINSCFPFHSYVFFKSQKLFHKLCKKYFFEVLLNKIFNKSIAHALRDCKLPVVILPAGVIRQIYRCNVSEYLQVCYRYVVISMFKCVVELWFKLNTDEWYHTVTFILIWSSVLYKGCFCSQS